MIIPAYNTIFSRVNTSGAAGAFEYTPIDNNYSMEFDGTNYIDISATATLSGKAIVSLSVWIKPNSISGSNERIFDENTSTAGYTRFGLERDTDTIQLKWRDASNDPSGSPGTLTTGSVLTAGVWVHILAIYDSSSNEQKIYIDGSLSISSSVSVSALGTSATHGINIGRNPNSLDHFNGNIDEVAIFNTALSEPTIEAIYNTTNDNPGKVADLSETPEGVPVAWYRFE